MTKVEKNIRKEQFKKVFSTYSQALQRTALDFDGMPGCYYQQNKNEETLDYNLTDISECEVFYDKFAKYLKVIKTCRGNALAGGCVPKYSSYTTASTCSGFNEARFNYDNTAYVLSDGSIIMPYMRNTGAIIAFDINGKKGPNIPGQDLFSVTIIRTPNGMLRLAPFSLHSCLPHTPGSMEYEDFFK